MTLVGPSARCQQRQNLALPNARRGTLHPSREKERNIFSSCFSFFFVLFFSVFFLCFCLFLNCFSLLFLLFFLLFLFLTVFSFFFIFLFFLFIFFFLFLFLFLCVFRFLLLGGAAWSPPSLALFFPLLLVGCSFITSSFVTSLSGVAFPLLLRGASSLFGWCCCSPSPVVGWCCLVSSSFWVVLLFFLLPCLWVVLRFSSSFAWCCLVSSFLGVVFLSFYVVLLGFFPLWVVSPVWWCAKPFHWNAEPQRRAAKHLGHTWYIGKRFCKSSRVFFGTLSAGIEFMGFSYIRTNSLLTGGEEWRPNTGSRSEMPVWTVSQKFNHPQ